MLHILELWCAPVGFEEHEGREAVAEEDHEVDLHEHEPHRPHRWAVHELHELGVPVQERLSLRTQILVDVVVL